MRTLPLLQTNLRTMNQLAKILRKKRADRGALQVPHRPPAAAAADCSAQLATLPFRPAPSLLASTAGQQAAAAFPPPPACCASLRPPCAAGQPGGQV